MLAPDDSWYFSYWITAQGDATFFLSMFVLILLTLTIASSKYFTALLVDDGCCSKMLCDLHSYSVLIRPLCCYNPYMADKERLYIQMNCIAARRFELRCWVSGALGQVYLCSPVCTIKDPKIKRKQVSYGRDILCNWRTYDRWASLSLLRMWEVGQSPWAQMDKAGKNRRCLWLLQFYQGQKKKKPKVFFIFN